MKTGEYRKAEDALISLQRTIEGYADIPRIESQFPQLFKAIDKGKEMMGPIEEEKAFIQTYHTLTDSDLTTHSKTSLIATIHGLESDYQILESQFRNLRRTYIEGSLKSLPFPS